MTYRLNKGPGKWCPENDRAYQAELAATADGKPRPPTLDDHTGCTYVVPGPICTAPTDAAFDCAAKDLGWRWSDGPDVVDLPDGQSADYGDRIKVLTGGRYRVTKLAAQGEGK